MDAQTRRPPCLALPVLLVIGDLQGWARQNRPVPVETGFFFLDFRDLTAAKVAQVQPDIILSGLFGADFDALDIASLLQEAGFRGRYRVVADRIPKPGLVRTEVRHVAPDVDFDVINLRGELVALV